MFNKEVNIGNACLFSAEVRCLNVCIILINIIIKQGGAAYIIHLFGF